MDCPASPMRGRNKMSGACRGEKMRKLRSRNLILHSKQGENAIGK